ncbi:hypothetical protein SAMN05720470_10818 [Fibrobacter sp. UWOV1]|nr:hypothetical protein SAMN05720470_10818 [Fibrobacter sp. UWOV1]
MSMSELKERDARELVINNLAYCPNEESMRVYLKYEADKVIAELKERSQWHRQKDKDIYFECGKHWGAEYIIKMKDGTTHLAYGGCDEGGDGSVSTFLHFQDEDYEWEYDDIDIWYEIPDHRIIGNIKETDK